MKFRFVTFKSAAAAIALGALIGNASASVASIGVEYSISGSAGNWVLDFNVANNMVGTNQNVYFFGVAVDDSSTVRAPSAFDYKQWPSWSNADVGGSSIVYNNNFFDNTFSSGVGAGTSLAGFVVRSGTVEAPTSVHWFAFSDGNSFGGSDSFFAGDTPGFEGMATPVPEPGSLALLAGGLLMMAAPRLRRGRDAR